MWLTMEPIRNNFLLWNNFLLYHVTNNIQSALRKVWIWIQFSLRQQRSNISLYSSEENKLGLGNPNAFVIYGYNLSETCRVHIERWSSKAKPKDKTSPCPCCLIFGCDHYTQRYSWFHHLRGYSSSELTNNNSSVHCTGEFTKWHGETDKRSRFHDNTMASNKEIPDRIIYSKHPRRRQDTIDQYLLTCCRSTASSLSSSMLTSSEVAVWAVA